MEIISLDNFITTVLIPGVNNWDRLFLHDPKITGRWISPKIEGKGSTASPCRLSKVAEEADSTAKLMKEFMINKTKEPIIYLICEKVDDEIAVEFNLQEQLEDANDKIDRLENKVKDLTKQLRKQRHRISEDSEPLPIISAFQESGTVEEYSLDKQVDIKEEGENVEVKSEPETVESSDGVSTINSYV